MTLSPAQSGARLAVRRWIGRERDGHADQKFAGSVRQNLMDELRDDPSGRGRIEFLNRYLERAATFGLDTPQGRQAMGKAAVTALALTEDSVELFGPMPQPGLPSGEVR